MEDNFSDSSDSSDSSDFSDSFDLSNISDLFNDIDVSYSLNESNDHHANNNNIPINWYILHGVRPDWINDYSGTSKYRLTFSYGRVFADHYNMTVNQHDGIRFDISKNGLATDSSINYWQIDRYQILKRMQNQHQIVASNQPMNYYLSLLRILINSACQLKDDIKNGLYASDLDPNLNEHGLMGYMDAVYTLQAICKLIINKMLPLVSNVNQQRKLIDFQVNFEMFLDLNNDKLEKMYRKLRHIIKQKKN